jgi:hypothetical protein
MQNAITTPELFRLLSLSIGREKEATPYMVAKVFGISPGAASSWKKGFTVMDENNAKKSADMLGLELDFVVLSLEAEKKNKSGMDKIAAIFERAALASQHHAASVVAVLVAVSALPSLAKIASQVCILCKACTPFFKPLRSASRA